MSSRVSGRIVIKGIVQGVGFRPFVYSQAKLYGIRGSVKNLGSEVSIVAFGSRFEEFLKAVSVGTVLSKIDSVEVFDIDDGDNAASVKGSESAAGGDDFVIEKSGRSSSLTGFIPADVAICDECVKDIFEKGGRYEGYWATSCVNCGPRYSIIREVPYDRERTTMDAFPMCEGCRGEYESPKSRRHHAQTIACNTCGPGLSLLDRDGNDLKSASPTDDAARLLDEGHIVAIKGIGGYHIACIESSAVKLKTALGRPEQALAIMATGDTVADIAVVGESEHAILNGPEHPIVVLYKKERDSHRDISNLDTIGCMLPYTGLHHLLFSKLKNRILIMTSANAPGNPMITDTKTAVSKLKGCVDYYLAHDRVIQNRCDDSVVREGYIIRLSRGYAPKRVSINLGKDCILGTGPELYTTVSIYKNGFCCTSPHIGNIKNPQTLEYLEDTVGNLKTLLGAEFDVIAHDMHPQFLSTRFAKRLSEETGAETVAVQHHRAHIAAAFSKYAAADAERDCVGIALDGVGLGDDGTVWGGEIFAGDILHLKRVAHLETVKMPGGDLATIHPERMLFGMLPCEDTESLLLSRGWKDSELALLKKQIERGFNVPLTSSAGRVLDAASALLGICRERTYDGEPAMKLEAAASAGRAEKWESAVTLEGDMSVLSTSAILKNALAAKNAGRNISDIAASVQFNLADGFAEIAVEKALDAGIKDVVLSGGVCINHTIRETIVRKVEDAGLNMIINREYPFGDGCISYGQCVYAGLLRR